MLLDSAAIANPRPLIVKKILQHNKIKPSIAAINKALEASINLAESIIFDIIIQNTCVLVEQSSVDQILLSFIELENNGMFLQSISQHVLNSNKASQTGINKALLKAVELDKKEIIHAILHSNGLKPNETGMNDALLKAVERANKVSINELLPIAGQITTAVKPDQLHVTKPLLSCLTRKMREVKIFLKSLRLIKRALMRFS